MNAKLLTIAGVSHREFVEDAVCYIDDNYPNLISFVTDENVLTSLEFYLRTYHLSDTLTTMLYMYGINFTLAFKEYCVEKEEYEVCTAILKAINEHNQVVKDKLPIKLNKRLFQRK